jgi:hypothetical protein
VKCSFCEGPLVCKACGATFEPPDARTHQAVYQADMAIPCPGCRRTLACKWCSFVYGDPEQEEQDIGGE